jgi:hypothetical protein
MVIEDLWIGNIDLEVCFALQSQSKIHDKVHWTKSEWFRLAATTHTTTAV